MGISLIRFTSPMIPTSPPIYSAKFWREESIPKSSNVRSTAAAPNEISWLIACTTIVQSRSKMRQMLQWNALHVVEKNQGALWTAFRQSCSPHLDWPLSFRPKLYWTALLDWRIAPVVESAIERPQGFFNFIGGGAVRTEPADGRSFRISRCRF